MERIQKILAHGGIASRRAAEELIKNGRVRVNGRIVTELGAKADPRRDRVEVDGKRVVAEHLVYVALHKPRGVVSTLSDPEGRPTVKELLANIGARVYPVGRLDFATSGILLVTNDGELAEGLLHPRKSVPKTYVVKVMGVMKPEDLDPWRKGVRLEDGLTRPAEAKLLRHEGDKTWFELTIREGRNQQVRRMGEATGFPVMRLARVAFADISAEGLAPGRWRHLTRDELVALKKTFGVPRSVPSAASIPESPAKRTRAVPAPRRGAAGRAQRAFGSESAGGPEPRGKWGDQADGPQRAAPRGKWGDQAGGPQRTSIDPPRYGGGATGRGAPRGRGSAVDPAAARSDRGAGRGGRPHTTGTGGRTGATEPASRTNGRRGRR